MHFGIDGTLWETYSPDQYDRMAWAILEGLEDLGHQTTFLGRSRMARPPAVPSSSRWMQAESTLAEKILPGGWRKGAVPRALQAGHMEKWLTWSGEIIPSGLGQWVFLKEVSELLWPGPAGVSKTVTAGFRKAWGEILRDPAAGVVLFSERAAAALFDILGGNRERIFVLPPICGNGPGPAPWDEKQGVKTAFSTGQEFFLWTGTIDERGHWREALKAFSQFKVRQRSQMQFLMAPWKISDPDFQDSLDSYKYRADVKVIGPGPELWEKAARGAYALLYTPEYDELGWVTGAALRMEIPLINTFRSVASEWAEDAVEWVDPNVLESIAEPMLKLYKDEAYRNRLLARGKALHAERDRASLLRQYEQVLTNATPPGV
jgi:glycosyltransferase involved in cell wall biosynthesis